MAKVNALPPPDFGTVPVKHYTRSHLMFLLEIANGPRYY